MAELNHIGAGGGSGRDAGAIGATWRTSRDRAGAPGGRGAVVGEETGTGVGARVVGAGFVGGLVARDESRRTVVVAVAEATALYEDRRALLGGDMESAASNRIRVEEAGRREGNTSFLNSSNENARKEKRYQSGGRGPEVVGLREQANNKWIYSST